MVLLTSLMVSSVPIRYKYVNNTKNVFYFCFMYYMSHYSHELFFEQVIPKCYVFFLYIYNNLKSQMKSTFSVEHVVIL